MTEAGFIIDQSLQECKRKTQKLKKEREYLEKQTNVINTKKTENDQIVDEVNIARKDFTQALQAELDSQLEGSNEAEQGSTNMNIARFLMEFLAAEKLPELVTGYRPDSEVQVIYVNGLQKLSLQNTENFHLLMDKTHKAVAEENDEEKALEEFIKKQDTTYDSLMERFDKVKQRHQVLTELDAESDEITK